MPRVSPVGRVQHEKALRSHTIPGGWGPSLPPPALHRGCCTGSAEPTAQPTSATSQRQRPKPASLHPAFSTTWERNEEGDGPDDLQRSLQPK